MVSGYWTLYVFFHMCLNRDLFKSFESIDGGKVLLGNNLTCKVAGIRTISIKMFDGVTKDLKPVRLKTFLHFSIS